MYRIVYVVPVHPITDARIEHDDKLVPLGEARTLTDALNEAELIFLAIKASFESYQVRTFLEHRKRPIPAGAVLEIFASSGPIYSSPRLKLIGAVRCEEVTNGEETFSVGRP